MVSIKDIAEKVGVSRNTVSKVFNNKSGVSEHIRMAVINSAIELGYSKLPSSAYKKSSENSQNMNISLIVTNPDFSNFWTRIINSISHELHINNNNLVYNFIMEENNNEFKIPSIISNGGASGLIVFNVYNEKIINVLAGTGLPIVYYDVPVNTNPIDAGGDIILLEGCHSIMKLTNHIISQNVSKLGFIGDITYCRTIYDRWAGFKEALRRNNIELNKDWCLTRGLTHNFYDNGEVERAIDGLKELPEAFVCANDVIGYITVKHLKAKGFTVPDDIIVSGYDNIKHSVTKSRFLSTVDVDNEYIGKRLVDQLLRRISSKGSFYPYEVIQLSTDIILRESTMKVIQS